MSLIDAQSKHSAVQLACLEALPIEWPQKKSSKSPEELTEELMVESTMMQSDMSGFTRLTRQYGILHFLTLIINCRKIYDDTISEFGGKVVKYDGDNVITFFSKPVDASQAAAALLQNVNAWNR